MQHHIGGRIQRESGDYTGNPWFCAVARLKQAWADQLAMWIPLDRRWTCLTRSWVS